MFKLTALIVVFAGCCLAHNHNKYSAEANKKGSDTIQKSDFRKLDKPFRMAKLNLLWGKAQMRLTEPKLRSLFSELKIHDKEELNLKKVRSEGKDKDGLLEADMRKRLIGIMSTYGLLEHFESVQDASQYHLHKPYDGVGDRGVFKDKKLNKLWEKAEHAGFSAEELLALREEFEHHQDKLEQYYSILSDVSKRDEDEDAENSVDDKLDKFNAINDKEEGKESISKDTMAKANLLRERHREIKSNYDRLNKLTSKGPNSKEFLEPKVQDLWVMAMNSNFSTEELVSLKTELVHYENRLLKLRHLQAEASLNKERHGDKKLSQLKSDEDDLIEETLKKHARKAEKLHLHIHEKIRAKHSEL